MIDEPDDLYAKAIATLKSLEEYFQETSNYYESSKKFYSNYNISKMYPLPDEWQINNPVVVSDEVEFIERFLASDQ